MYIYLKDDFDNKLRYVVKTLIGFIPNYVMAAMVLYTYTRASKLDHQTDVWIFYGFLRFVMQILIYTFLTTKELTNTKTYVIGMITSTT